MAIIPAISLIALFVVAIVTLKDDLKSHRFGTLIFAMICLGLGIAGTCQALPFILAQAASFLMSLIWASLLIGAISLITFVTGVKGLKLLQARQWWPIVLALLIGLLLPAVQVAYDFWTMDGPPTSGSFSQRLLFLLFSLVPYTYLGALLLALACNESGTYDWRVTRGFGIMFVLVLLVNVIAVVLYDINLWVNGGIGGVGIWPLLGGQRGNPRPITSALILVVTLGLVLLALIRSFLIRPEEEQSAERLAAKVKGKS